MNEVGLRKNELDTPILWVELATLEANIAKLAEHFKCARTAWRPHIKGIKTPAIAHKAIAAGAIGVTCAKLGEAEVMAAAGITDILIANQLVTPQKITRLVNLRKYTDVKLAVDDPDNVVALGMAAQEKGVELGVLVEIDIGMKRGGVPAGKAVLKLASLVAKTAGLKFLGVMSWEGHVLKFKDGEERRREIDKAMASVAESVALCAANGLACAIVSGGGSGTAEYTPFIGVNTEIQAGGIVFSDATYKTWNRLTEPSLFVRTTVTSRPTTNKVITDAGYKTLPAWHKQPEGVAFPEIVSFTTSAEHGIITLKDDDDDIKVGDAFDFMVGYGDATVFLHDHIYGIREGVVEAVWPLLGRGKLR